MSFKSVKATGDLASGLSAHADSISYVEHMCRSVSALTEPSRRTTAVQQLGLGTASGDRDPCVELGKDANAWGTVVGGLAGYGKALSTLADSKDVDVSAQLEGVRSGLVALKLDALGTDEAKAAVKATNSLVALIVRELRRKALRDAVTDANPHVQQVCTQLAAHVKQQLIILEDMENNQRNLVEDLTSPVAHTDVFVCHDAAGVSIPCDAPELRRLTAALALSQGGWIEERRTALAQLHDAVLALAAAHQVLTDDAAELGRNDAATLGKIIKEIKAVYDGIDALTSAGEKSNKETAGEPAEPTPTTPQ